jgi:hypothetical protein
VALQGSDRLLHLLLLLLLLAPLLLLLPLLLQLVLRIASSQPPTAFTVSLLPTPRARSPGSLSFYWVARFRHVVFFSGCGQSRGATGSTRGDDWTMS